MDDHLLRSDEEKSCARLRKSMETDSNQTLLYAAVP